MNKLKLAAAAIVTLLGLIIILQNSGEVKTRLLFFSITMPQALLLLLTALMGFAVGFLVALVYQKLKKPPKP